MRRAAPYRDVWVTAFLDRHGCFAVAMQLGMARDLFQLDGQLFRRKTGKTGRSSDARNPDLHAMPRAGNFIRQVVEEYFILYLLCGMPQLAVPP